MSKYQYEQLFIGGQWVDPLGNETIEIISPHTEEVIGHVRSASPDDVDRAIASANDAFYNSEWPHMPPDERRKIVERLLVCYRQRTEEIAQIVTAEMGSPRWFSELAQGNAAAAMLETFINSSKAFDWQAPNPTLDQLDDSQLKPYAMVRHEPVGVVGAITPWNVPQLVIMPKLAPALLTGCSIVIKPAPESPLDAMLLAEIIEEAELPKGVVSIIPGGRSAGERLVGHRGVDKVAFTGSSAVGKQIAQVCGARLARFSLELGGKSAALILDDSDLSQVVSGLQFASLMNSGQACVAQTRILASRERYDEVVDAVSDMVTNLVVGDPSDLSTYIGPLVSKRQQLRVENYIDIGIQEGANIVVGGLGMPKGLDRGWYVKPTVFANVENSMRVAREEIFGPVLSIIEYKDEDDAIRLANDSPYGLAGSIWSNDRDHAVTIAKRIRSGMVGINGFAPDLSSPFGGYKESGIGREYGQFGLEGYCELKSIYGV